MGYRLLACLLLINIAFAKPLPITFWHSMSGMLGIEVNKLVNQFNHSQSKYKVIPIYKGNYPQTLTATVAAFRAQQQPDIVQIFEVGTALMSNPPGAIVPVYKIMRDANIPISSQQFLPAIASYYSDQQGRLLAFPFNSSTPVMFYNKQAFQKAGLNPNKPPQTWPQLKAYSEKLLKSGYACGFTTTWPSWIQLEAFSAWQNLPFATEDNGFKSSNPKLVFNNKIVMEHIANLARWQQQKIFVYGGRGDNAMALFTSGQCPIIMESSGSSADIQADTPFDVGIAAIPYSPQVKAAPQNMLIGGAALWVMSGHSKAVYQGVAAFLKFLSQPKIQAGWQQATGYLPVTKAAFKLSQREGFYKKNPGAMVAIKELMHKAPTNNSKGIRLGGYPQIRQLNNDALEAVFSGQASAKKALTRAVTEGDVVIKQFAENVS